MKKLLLVGGTVVMTLCVSSAMAADYFCSDPLFDDGNNHADVLSSIWYPVGASSEDAAIAPSTATANDNFWIVGGANYSSGGHTATAVNFRDGQRRFDGKGILNLGAPANHSLFPGASGDLRHRKYANCYLYTTRLNWYNGAINNMQYYTARLFGDVYVYNDAGSSHSIWMNDSNRWLELRCSFVSDSTDAKVSIANSTLTSMDKSAGVRLLMAPKADGQKEDAADATSNARYKGSFALTTAYLHFYFGCDHPLGDPATPHEAALSVCDKGSFGMHCNGEQSPNRAIRLEGESAYYYAMNSGCTLKYPITRAAGVAGKLIKYDAHEDIFDCVFSAGDIEVQKGTLVLGLNFKAPAGTNIKVCDGAKLVSYVDLASFNVKTEGSGSAGYAEGYRYQDGVLQFKVTVNTVGDGTVTPTEIWANPEMPVEATATPVSGDFLNWSGDFSAFAAGSSPFDSVVAFAPKAPTSVTANFGTVTTPDDVRCEDGTTLTYANRVLTINVPQDRTSTYDYSSAVLSGLITNVVKIGGGTFQPPAMASYFGDFDIREGGWLSSAPAEFGADNVGTLRFAKGTVNYINTTSAMGLGKRVFCGGRFEAKSDQWNASGYLKNCDVVFTDAVTLRQIKNAIQLFKGSRVDLAGHPLTLSSANNYSAFEFDGIAFTNSAETAVTLSAPNDFNSIYLMGETSFSGGPRNKLNFGWDTRIYVSTFVKSDWTLDLNTLYHLNGGSETVNTTNFQWTGAVAANYFNSAYEGDQYLNCNVTDSCLTFGGPLSGEKALKIKGGVLNLLSANNTYSGQMRLQSARSSKLRSLIKVWDGANFSHSASQPVYIENGDFEIGTDTSYSLPSFMVASGTSTFRGGPSADKPCGRATLVDFTAGGTSLTVDSPVVLKGMTAVNAGTLALGAAPKTAAELPVFSNLVFAAGTAFDMKGNDLTVPNLTGFPTVLNPGTLTIAGTWTIDFADLVDGKTLDLGAGSLVFAEGAKIVIANRTGSATGELTPAKAASVTGNPALIGWRRTVVVADGRVVLKPLGAMILIR